MISFRVLFLALCVLDVQAFSRVERRCFLAQSRVARCGEKSTGGGEVGRFSRRRWVQDSAALTTAALVAEALSPKWAVAEEEEGDRSQQLLGSSIASEPAAEALAADAAPTTPTSVVVPEFAEGFPSEATVPYKGKNLPLKKFRGKATLVVNLKTDDPEGTRQLPPLAYLATKYAPKGFKVLGFPTEQVTTTAAFFDI